MTHSFITFFVTHCNSFQWLQAYCSSGISHKRYLLVQSQQWKDKNIVWNPFKVRNNDTGTMSMTLLWCLYRYLWSDFLQCWCFVLTLNWLIPVGLYNSWYSTILFDTSVTSFNSLGFILHLERVSCSSAMIFCIMTRALKVFEKCTVKSIFVMESSHFISSNSFHSIFLNNYSKVQVH